MFDMRADQEPKSLRLKFPGQNHRWERTHYTPYSNYKFLLFREAYATHDLRTLKEGQECEELRVIITSTWQMNARQLSWILNASWVLTLQLSMSVKSSSLELKSRSASPVPHIRTRIIRTSFGRSIKHFSDLTELLQVLRDGIEGE